MTITRAEMVRLVTDILAAAGMEGVGANDVTWIRLEPDAVYIEVYKKSAWDSELTKVAVHD